MNVDDLMSWLDDENVLLLSTSNQNVTRDSKHHVIMFIL